MYLIFGEDKVLMQDTGAGGIPIATAVYGIIDDWLAANGKSSIELIVTHSHGHGDHVGDTAKLWRNLLDCVKSRRQPFSR